MYPTWHSLATYSLVYSLKISINPVPILKLKRTKSQKLSNKLINRNLVCLGLYSIKVLLVRQTLFSVSTQTTQQVLIYSQCLTNLYLVGLIYSVQLTILQNQGIFSLNKQKMKMVNRKVTVLNSKKNNR